MSHLVGTPVLGSSGFAKVPLQKQAAMSSSQTLVHFPVAFGPIIGSLHEVGSPCAFQPELHTTVNPTSQTNHKIILMPSGVEGSKRTPCVIRDTICCEICRPRMTAVIRCLLYLRCLLVQGLGSRCRHPSPFHPAQ